MAVSNRNPLTENSMPSNDEKAPTVKEIRDNITVNTGQTGVSRVKTVGDDEVVAFHPTGAKYSIKVKEIKNT